jgi:hypothetical protein
LRNHHFSIVNHFHLCHQSQLTSHHFHVKKMDPLSVMASVVGLLAAAGQVTSVLSTVKSSIKDAPRSMDHAISEVKAVEISLSAIQKFLLGLSSAPRQRITMIQVDQLLATLTEAVLTFSDLEALVKPLATDSESSMIERIRWCWKEDDVSRIMIRLERHKSSLSLMLNIVQWYVCTFRCPSGGAGQLIFGSANRTWRRSSLDICCTALSRSSSRAIRKYQDVYIIWKLHKTPEAF